MYLPSDECRYKLYSLIPTQNPKLYFRDFAKNVRYIIYNLPSLSVLASIFQTLTRAKLVGKNFRPWITKVIWGLFLSNAVFLDITAFILGNFSWITKKYTYLDKNIYILANTPWCSCPGNKYIDLK